MKKLFATILMSSAVFAAEEKCNIEPDSQIPEFVISGHEITPNFRWFKHKETNYNYSKYIGGFEYNYNRSAGLNFNSFLGYSVYEDKSYFVADWAVKYLTTIGILKDTVKAYPVIGMSSTSNISTDSAEGSLQLYRSTFNGGLGVIYNPCEFLTMDAGFGYFKDLATSCVLHQGDEFWGKNYFSPSGLKMNLNCRFHTLLNKDIEIGGFYAQTIKKCYKEYGMKAAIAFSF